MNYITIERIAHKVVGTGWRTTADATYKQVVAVLGEPDNLKMNEWKEDAEWIVYLPDANDVLTVYNYKDGKHYLGAEGTETEDITTWHIGGHGTRQKEAEELKKEIEAAKA